MMIRRALTALTASMLLLGSAHCSSSPADASVSDGPSEDNLTAAINVKPLLTIGTGNGGAGANDINAPDGIIFNKTGNLLITDAANHRVQVWDIKNNRRLGDFGSPELFRGEVVDLAENPLTGQVIVTDEDTHVAYAFDPPTGREAGDAAFAGYKSSGPDWFSGENVIKVGGITYDSKGRIYTVDARQNLVRRYDSKGKPDPTFKFAELGSVKYLNGCEGIAVDEKRGNLYVSNEFDSVIQVFDLASGAYKKQTIGKHSDPATPGVGTGPSVFPAAIEGLWMLDDYLLASSEADGGVGSVMIFDLSNDKVFNTGPDDWKTLEADRKASPYKGAFGSFSSPDSVTAWTDADGESYVAVADQGHFKVPVYRWSDVVKAGKFARP